MKRLDESVARKIFSRFYKNAEFTKGGNKMVDLDILKKFVENKFPENTQVFPQNVEKNSIPAQLINGFKGKPEDICWVYNKSYYPRYLAVFISNKLLQNKEAADWITNRQKKQTIKGKEYTLYVF